MASPCERLALRQIPTIPLRKRGIFLFLRLGVSAKNQISISYLGNSALYPSFPSPSERDGYSRNNKQNLSQGEAPLAR